MQNKRIEIDFLYYGNVYEYLLVDKNVECHMMSNNQETLAYIRVRIPIHTSKSKIKSIDKFLKYSLGKVWRRSGKMNLEEAIQEAREIMLLYHDDIINIKRMF